MVVCKTIPWLTFTFAITSVCFHSEQGCRKARPAKPDTILSFPLQPHFVQRRLLPVGISVVENHKLLRSMFDMISLSIQLFSRWLFPPPLNSTKFSSGDNLCWTPGAQGLCLPKYPDDQGRSGRVRSKIEWRRMKWGEVRWAWIESGRGSRCRTSGGGHAEHSPG